MEATFERYVTAVAAVIAGFIWNSLSFVLGGVFSPLSWVALIAIGLVLGFCGGQVSEYLAKRKE